MEDGTVYLDPTADDGMIATMTEATAEELGWSLNGTTIEDDGDGYCYALVGYPWDDERSDADNDAQHDADWRECLREIEAAGLDWKEIG